MIGSSNRKSEIIDDSNFIYLPTGTYPQDYIGLAPMMVYHNYYQDVIKPWTLLNKRPYITYQLPENLNVNAGIVYEYWERIPEEIISKSDIQRGKFNKENIYVSSFGRIFNRKLKKFLTTYIRKDGYVGYGNTPVHRIVLYTFCPREDFKSLTVDHLSCNVTENYLWNLSWKNIKDNIMRSRELGHINPWFKNGETNKNSTVSDFTVELICMALATKQYNYHQIAYMANVTPRFVKHIKDGDCRRDIAEKYGILDMKFDFRSVTRDTTPILPLYGVNHR